MSTVDAAIINHITNGGGSSGGGGSGGVSYTAGDAISLTNNRISVQYDADTMELKNGKLSAKTSSSGGGGSGGTVPTEDVLEKFNGQDGTFSGDVYTIACADSNRNAITRSGNIIKLKGRSGEISSYILIVKANTIPASIGEDNALLIDEYNTITAIKIWGESTIKFVIPAAAGSIEEFNSNNVDVGLFNNTNMSIITMQKVIRYATGALP